MSKTGLLIKERRKQLDMSADALASKIGVSRSTVFRYENGDIDKVPAEHLPKIAKALNTSVQYLMGWQSAATTDVAELLADITTDLELLEHVKKLRSLDEKNRSKVYRFLDMLLED